MIVGYLRAQAVALFAHHEQHAHGRTLLAQALAGGNLRGHDSLGVAGAAPIDILPVF